MSARRLTLVALVLAAGAALLRRDIIKFLTKRSGTWIGTWPR